MSERECVLCGTGIPRKTRDKLIDLGYSGVDDHLTHRTHMFCQNHSPKEISDYIIKNKVGFR